MTRTTDQPKLDLDRILQGEAPPPDPRRPAPRKLTRRLATRKTGKTGGKGCCGRGLNG